MERSLHFDDMPSLKAPRFRTFRTVMALILREMGTTYGRSPGGYIWAILSPIGAIVMMALAFSLFVHAPSLGTSFILFYATGFLPFDLFNQLSAKIGQSIRYSKPLLKYPGVTWLDAILGRFVLNFLTLLTAFAIVIIGIIVAIDHPVTLDILPILVGLILTALIGLGVGMLNCLLTGYFPVWERIWAIISRPLFLASGVLFLYENLPAPVQHFLWWNPLLHAISLIRTGFYPTYHATFVSLSYSFGVALGLILISQVFLRNGYLATMEN